MKKKYFTPEMEEMKVEMPSLLESTAETSSDTTCTTYDSSGCPTDWA